MFSGSSNNTNRSLPPLFAHDCRISVELLRVMSQNDLTKDDTLELLEKTRQAHPSSSNSEKLSLNCNSVMSDSCLTFLTVSDCFQWSCVLQV